MTSPAATPRPLVGGRAARLAGASLAAMTASLAAGASHGQTLSVLRALQGNLPVATAAQQALAAQQNYGLSAPNPAMVAALARANQNEGHLATALSLAQQAQSAARAAAAALNGGVPNGLAPGGLQIAPNLTTAAQDKVGVRTWQGANLPTSDPNNPNNVSVVQTQQQAVLSWTTFNVGQQTTLTFQQQPSWVVLNRVVGQLDPSTGLRIPGQAPAPSQILGSIKGAGTVLVINQNGILFSPTAQINVGSLIATSLELGAGLQKNFSIPGFGISQANQAFLSGGLLGSLQGYATPVTFSAQATSYDSNGQPTFDPLIEGPVEVATGATIATGASGSALLIAPTIVNGGQITSPNGQISLISGRSVTFTPSNGDANSVDPNLRGEQITTGNVGGFSGDYVDNQANSLLAAPGGYTSLQATSTGAVLHAGVIDATTSVSLNGYVNLQGGDIELAPGAVIAITPDAGPATIPQSVSSVLAFKTSVIRIGDVGANIDIGSNSLVYAPSGAISIGADAGQVGFGASPTSTARVFVDDGAVIDAAGVPNVQVPASSLLITDSAGDAKRSRQYAQLPFQLPRWSERCRSILGSRGSTPMGSPGSARR